MGIFTILLAFVLVYALAKIDDKRDRKKGRSHDWKYYAKKSGTYYKD